MIRHVLAAFRLQRAIGQMQAVLTPAQRSALQRAVKVFDSIASRPALQDWDAAFDAWQGLVAGRWMLVQSFESSGRRYLMARRRAPGAALRSLAPCALTLRAQGESYKAIAAELGISIACAHQLVKAACQRLGVHDDSELPQLLRCSSRSPDVAARAASRTPRACPPT